MAFNIPSSLEDLCLDAICNNLRVVFDVYYEDFASDAIPFNSIDWNFNRQGNKSVVKIRRYCFKNKNNCFLHRCLSEKLLIKLGMKKLLNDSTICLFTRQNTLLKNVCLRNAVVSVTGLNILKEHNIVELNCCELKMNLNEVISCLNEWSLENLEILKISKCTVMETVNYSIVNSLLKLRNLRSLNISHLAFYQPGFELICRNMDHLEHLDISCLRIHSLAPITVLSDGLTSLTMFNLILTVGNDLMLSLLRFKNLKYLDLSSIKFLHVVEGTSAMRMLLCHPNAFPRLRELDISGVKGISVEALSTFLKNHPKLTFLGLLLTRLCFEEVFFNERHRNFRPKLKIAGYATKQQVCLALKRYILRSYYVEKCLQRLYWITITMQEPQPDLIQILLPIMEFHSKNLGIQVFATSCLFILLKITRSLHPILLTRAANITINVMNQFYFNSLIQKNALFILYNYNILLNSTFDIVHCGRSILITLRTLHEPIIKELAVVICTILAARVINSAKRFTYNASYIKKIRHLISHLNNGDRINVKKEEAQTLFSHFFF